MQLTARDILAKTLQAEAGNQGPLGMLSVGSVIMNRLMSGKYPNKLHDVILQPGQFSAWNKSTGYADGQQGQNMDFTPTASAYSVADQLLDANYNDPTGGATHFYNPDIVNPSWGKDAGGNWKTIGNHVFGIPNDKEASMETGFNNPVMNATSRNSADPSQNGANSNPLFKMLGNAVGGGFDQLKNAVTGRDPDASDRLAIGLMQLSGQPQQFAPLMQLAANDIQERKKLRQTNKTIEYLETIDPKLAEMARNNPAMITSIMQQVTSSMINPKTKKGTLPGSELKQAFPDNVNIEEGKLYNVEYDDEGTIIKATPVGGGGIKNEIIMPGGAKAENKLLEKLMGATGDQWAAMMSQGNAAAQLSVDLEILARLAPLAPSGPLQGRLAENFPEFNDVSALRQSIIKRIAPTLRVEGSGSTSDTEFNAMLDGFGSLKNTPEANVAIISVFQKKAAFDIARAKIVRNYSTGDITFKEANDQMGQLEQQSLIPQEVDAIIQRFSIDDSDTDTGPKRLRWDMETKSFI
jgi:hypothetical protein